MTPGTEPTRTRTVRTRLADLWSQLAAGGRGVAHQLENGESICAPEAP